MCIWFFLSLDNLPKDLYLERVGMDQELVGLGRMEKAGLSAFKTIIPGI